MTRTPLRAYLLVDGVPRGDGKATWSLSIDYDAIMSNDPEQTIFLPDGFSGYVDSIYAVIADKLPASFYHDLNERYPALHRLLPRFHVREHRGYVTVTADERAYPREYRHTPGESEKAANSPSVKTFYGRCLGNLVIMSTDEPEYRTYRGTDVTTLMELCQLLGGRIRVGSVYEKDSQSWRSPQYFFRRSASIYVSNKEEAAANADALEEGGYLFRTLAEKDTVTLEEHGYAHYLAEVVYDPKRVHRYMKARLTRQRKREERKAAGLPPVETKYASFDEMNQLTKQLCHDAESLFPSRFIGGNLYCGRDRYLLFRSLLAAVSAINELAGKNAHRYLESFQSLRELWEKKGEATREGWAKVAGDEWTGFCDWMDRELKAKRPPKKLMGRQRLRKIIDDRSTHLFEEHTKEDSNQNEEIE